MDGTRLAWLVRAGLGAGILVAVAWLLAPHIRVLLQSAPVVAADRLVAAWLHDRSTAQVLDLMHKISLMHGTAGILAMTAIAATALCFHGERAALPVLVVTVPGGLLLNVAVKHVVQRARPDWGYGDVLGSFSFPSSHTAGATVFYSALVVWLWPRLRAAWQRAALLIAVASMLTLVAASRIGLGVHYPSDCVAAFVEALLWAGICLVRAPLRAVRASPAP